VFKVQDEIAEAVVDQLKVKLLGAAPKTAVTDPEAYALMLRAREIMRLYGATAPNEAIALYKRALVIDPTYAPAWDGLADGYFRQTDVALVPGDQTLPLAREAVNKALTIDPRYAPAYARAALIEGVLAGDLVAAARRVEQGLALDPSNLDLIGVAIKIARRLGRMQQSVDLAEYVVERDPVNAYGYDQLASGYFYLSRWDDAVASYRNALAISPVSATEHGQIGEILLLQGDAKGAVAEFQQEPVENYRLFGLAGSYYALGRKVESDAVLDELIRHHEQTIPYSIAQLLAYRREPTRAFEWLGKAIRYRDSLVGLITFDPWLQSLHTDPRWLPLLQQLGKTPDQLAAIKFDVKVPK